MDLGSDIYSNTLFGWNQSQNQSLTPQSQSQSVESHRHSLGSHSQSLESNSLSSESHHHSLTFHSQYLTSQNLLLDPQSQFSESHHQSMTLHSQYLTSHSLLLIPQSQSSESQSLIPQNQSSESQSLIPQNQSSEYQSLIPQNQSSESQSLIPQNQSLIPQSQYLDHQGQFLDLQGQFLDPQGQFLDPQGQFLDPPGQFLDLQGQFFDPQGQFLEPQIQSAESQKQSLMPKSQSLIPQSLFLQAQSQFSEPQHQFLEPQLWIPPREDEICDSHLMTPSELVASIESQILTARNSPNKDQFNQNFSQYSSSQSQLGQQFNYNSQPQPLPLATVTIPSETSNTQVTFNSSLSVRPSQFQSNWRTVIIRSIEDKFAEIVTALSEDRFPQFARVTTMQSGETKKEDVVDLGKHCNQTKFTILAVIMGRAHNLLITQNRLTYRDLYYENVLLFRNQQTVNSNIRFLSSLLQVPIDSLPFDASPKGLIAGGKNLQLMHVSGGNRTDSVAISKKGTLLPTIHVLKDWGRFSSNAKFILIVEKDAIFQRLIDENIFGLYDPFIMITGKGMPDRGTKVFTHKLSTDLQIPLFALVDGDAYGLLIAVNYKHGSKNSQLIMEKTVTMPNLIVLGILPTEFEELSMDPDSKLSFGKRDVAIVKSLEERLTKLKDQELLEQVRMLKLLNYKVETEAVATIGPSFLLQHLGNKLRQHGISPAVSPDNTIPMYATQ